jgi:hypothetical protein
VASQGTRPLLPGWGSGGGTLGCVEVLGQGMCNRRLRQDCSLVSSWRPGQRQRFRLYGLHISRCAVISERVRPPPAGRAGGVVNLIVQVGWGSLGACVGDLGLSGLRWKSSIQATTLNTVPKCRDALTVCPLSLCLPHRRAAPARYGMSKRDGPRAVAVEAAEEGEEEGRLLPVHM